MRPKSLILLALALGCGLVASIGISQVMEKNRGEAKDLETEAIYVAAKDLREGDKLTEEMVVLEQKPKAAVPPGSISLPADFLGKRVRIETLKGEPISKNKIADKLSDREIPPQYTTVTVAVDAVSIQGGLIKPRDIVDVLCVFTKNPSLGVTDTGVKTVSRRIEVWAIDNQYRRGDSNEEGAIGKVVTLLVTKKQAKQVTLAAEIGKIRLVQKPLDASNDEESNDDQELMIGNLGKESAKPVTPVVTPAPTVVASAAPTPTPLTPKAGILDWLNGTEHPEAASDTATADPNRPKPFHMMILEGGQVRDVAFDEGGTMPASSRKIFDKNGAGATPEPTP